MVRLASRPSIGVAEAFPAPEVPAPDWLVLAALASGFGFFEPQPETARDAARMTANTTSDLRITFRSHIPTAQSAGRFLSQTMGPPHRRCELGRPRATP